MTPSPSPFYNADTDTVDVAALRRAIQAGDFDQIPEYVSARWLSDLCQAISKAGKNDPFPLPDEMVRDALALGRSGRRALVTASDLKAKKEKLVGKKEKARQTAQSLLD